MELLLVLTIIGMASILVVPNVGNLDSRSFATQVRQANTLLNYARRTAVVQGQPAAIEFFAQNSEFRDELALTPSRNSVGSWESTGATIIFVDSTERETEIEEKLVITFFPEGGSTGGTLILALDDRIATIEIDPFSGRVTNKNIDED